MPLSKQERDNLNNINQLSKLQALALKKRIEEELEILKEYQRLYRIRKELQGEEAKKFSELKKVYDDIDKAWFEEAFLVRSSFALKKYEDEGIRMNTLTTESRSRESRTPGSKEKSASLKSASLKQELQSQTFLPSASITAHKPNALDSQSEPTLHRKIKPEDINRTNKLLITDEEFEKVKAAFAKDPKLIKIKRAYQRNPEKKRKLNKLEKQINLKFSVIRADNGKLYALYRGKENLLGAGGFGQVKLGQDLETGEWVAVKTQVSHGNYKDWKKNVRKEGELTQERNQQIAMAKRRTDEWWHRNKKAKSYSVQHIIKGQNIADYQPKNFEEKLDMAMAVLKELKGLHESNILHLDIKPENMFYDPTTKKATIIDYGISLRIKPGAIAEPSIYSRGTTAYYNRDIPTRVSQDKKYIEKLFSKSHDVFAMAFSLLDIFTDYRRFLIKSKLGSAYDELFKEPNNLVKTTQGKERLNVLFEGQAVPETLKKEIKELVLNMASSTMYNYNKSTIDNYIQSLQSLKDKYLASPEVKQPLEKEKMEQEKSDQKPQKTNEPRDSKKLRF